MRLGAIILTRFNQVNKASFHVCSTFQAKETSSSFVISS